MNTIECIKTRRSIRKYKDELVDRETIKKIVEAASFAPSWKNTQIVRYIVIEDKEKIELLANTAVLNFTYNIRTMMKTRTLIIQTVVTGICGYEDNGSFSTFKEDKWEMYDAGISAQTFCLAAHEYGIGTVIMGMMDEDKIREIINIPENEMPTAIISMGYPDQQRSAPQRKLVDELLRFE